MSGFKKFLLRGNVVELAVAVVIGAAFTAIVQSIVKGLITPLIGVFGGIPDFAAWAVTINNSRFALGDVINAIIAFIIVAAIVYFMIVMPYERLQERFKTEEPAGPKTRECPECLSKVPVAATRCAFCTTQLTPAETMPVA